MPASSLTTKTTTTRYPIPLTSIFHEGLSLCEVRAGLARSAAVGMLDGAHDPDGIAGLCVIGYAGRRVQGRRWARAGPVGAVAGRQLLARYAGAVARGSGLGAASAGDRQPSERGHQRPGPVVVEAQADPAGVADEPAGGVPQPIAQGLGSARASSLSSASSSACAQQTRVWAMATRVSQTSLAPTSANGRLARPVALAQRMRSSTRAWARWPTSRAAGPLLARPGGGAGRDGVAWWRAWRVAGSGSGWLVMKTWKRWPVWSVKAILWRAPGGAARGGRSPGSPPASPGRQGPGPTARRPTRHGADGPGGPGPGPSRRHRLGSGLGRPGSRP